VNTTARTCTKDFVSVETECTRNRERCSSELRRPAVKNSEPERLLINKLLRRGNQLKLGRSARSRSCSFGTLVQPVNRIKNHAIKRLRARNARDIAFNRRGPRAVVFTTIVCRTRAFSGDSCAAETST